MKRKETQTHPSAAQTHPSAANNTNTAHHRFFSSSAAMTFNHHPPLHRRTLTTNITLIYSTYTSLKKPATFPWQSGIAGSCLRYNSMCSCLTKWLKCSTCTETTSSVSILYNLHCETCYFHWDLPLHLEKDWIYVHIQASPKHITTLWIHNT